MNVETTAIEVDDHLSNPRFASLRERTSADIEWQVMKTSASSPLDDLCAALDSAEWLVARARTIEQLIKQIAVAWIDRNGAFTIGEVQYWVGYATSVKCQDVAKAGQAVLDAAGGDLDRLFEVLVSQPFKHGTVRRRISSDLYDRLFTSCRTGRLVKGEPERVLKHADARYLPERPRQ